MKGSRRQNHDGRSWGIERWMGVGIVLALGSSVLPGWGADWPEWRGPDRDGISRETSWRVDWPAEGPSQVWEASVGIGYSSVSVSDGRVFTMGNTDQMDSVYAIDRETGDILWTHSYPCVLEVEGPDRPGPRCTPTVDGDRVYTVSREGHLFCFDAATGEIQWKRHLVDDLGGAVPRWGYCTSPLVVGKKLIVEPGSPKAGRGDPSATGNAVAALNKHTGELIWGRGTAKAGYASPIEFDSNGVSAVAIFHGKAVVARRLSDGHELWRYPWETSHDVNAATPIVSGNRMFISSGYNTGGAVIDFSDNSPELVWKNRNMRNHMNPCVLIDGYLYGFDESTFKCIDFDTGKEMWAEDLYGEGAIMAAGKRLIIQGNRGLLAIGRAAPGQYQEIARAHVLGGKDVWATPTLANGRIYCRHHENLLCLNVSK